MLCPRCGYYSDREDPVCPECGEILSYTSSTSASAAEMIRQGKRARQAIRTENEKESLEARRKRRSGASHATVEMPAVLDNRLQEDAIVYPVSDAVDPDDDNNTGFERRRRTVYDENSAREEEAELYAARMESNRRQKMRMINWIRIALISVILLVLIIAGSWLFLNKTEAGQKIMARLGREATSAALWAVGEERMNDGDIDGAIADFEKAK
ncbi:MAG: hypothetical protein IKE81_03370, partial [Clostridia bacterium]|nr:hypothetical protein [Clostridia bacterium]